MTPVLVVVFGILVLPLGRLGFVNFVGASKASTCNASSPGTDGDHVADCWEAPSYQGDDT